MDEADLATKKAYDNRSPESVQAMFGAIATRYDRANALLSLSLHRYWNKKLVCALAAMPTQAPLLDLCCGTGEIGFAFMRRRRDRGVYMLDFCPEMLKHAQLKATKLSLPVSAIHYLHADAERVPLADSSVGSVSIAYGVRNLCDPSRCFREVWRLLEDGGSIAILELTRPKGALLRLFHSLYLRSVVPLMGHWLTKERAAYEYLCRSIESFIEPETMANLLRAAGFVDIATYPLSGGIATLLTAKKDRSCSGL